MGNTRCLFDSLWVQLKKFVSLISWPPWLENRESWIIKIGAEFIIQVSLVLSQRRLHDCKNHLFCDVKISSFNNWFIEVWMSTENGRVTISGFSSDTDEQKQALQKTVIFWVLQIRWLGAIDISFSSSKTTCSISATSYWVLKLKVTLL